MKKFVICENEYMFSKKCFEPTIYLKEAESFANLIKDIVGINDTPECLKGLGLSENYTDDDIIKCWNKMDLNYGTENSVRKSDEMWDWIIFDTEENKIVYPVIKD